MHARTINCSVPKFCCSQIRLRTTSKSCSNRPLKSPERSPLKLENLAPLFFSDPRKFCVPAPSIKASRGPVKATRSAPIVSRGSLSTRPRRPIPTSVSDQINTPTTNNPLVAMGFDRGGRGGGRGGNFRGGDRGGRGGGRGSRGGGELRQLAFCCTKVLFDLDMPFARLFALGSVCCIRSRETPPD